MEHAFSSRNILTFHIHKTMKNPLQSHLFQLEQPEPIRSFVFPLHVQWPCVLYNDSTAFLMKLFSVREAPWELGVQAMNKCKRSVPGTQQLAASSCSASLRRCPLAQLGHGAMAGPELHQAAAPRVGRSAAGLQGDTRPVRSREGPCPH